MSERICSIEGCERKVLCRGWCNSHYAKWRAHGTTDGNPHKPRQCSIDGCDRKHYGRGWCHKHYGIWLLHGDPQGGKYELLRGVPVEERFWHKVDRSGDCWLWTGVVHRKGYGQFGDGQRIVQAHRFSYELVNGQIPEGMQIDHMCHTRRCVNPEHLRLATNKQNIENVSGARSDSTTGVRGVLPSGKRLMAAVVHNGERHYLGRFDTIKDAEAAVIAKRLELFTHNLIDRRGA